ncbi:MAG: hypothetical protein BWX74_00053 [Tenericutes bacterium ADurb.Bin087]|nr:MAG: hypothetical protein BWX74_00053 [Tenericutes bacterium ADurb.Bin087]
MQIILYNKFMNQKLYELALNVHEKIEEHSAVLLLVEYEKAMCSDGTVQALIDEYDCLQSEINNMLESSTIDHPQMKDKCRVLYKLKYVLDSEPLVKRYNKQYNLVNKMYKKITDELLRTVGLKRDNKCLLKEE